MTPVTALLLASVLLYHEANAFHLPSHPSRGVSLKTTQFSTSVRNSHDILPSKSSSKAGVIFPGGGLFFYWQAGVIVSE